MARLSTVMLAIVISGLAGNAISQDRAGGRYAFVPAENGTMRLDTETGEVSLCSDNGNGLACRPVRDDAEADREALARIEKRLTAIEEKLADDRRALRDPVPTLQDEEAVDRAMDLAERVMRRFFDLVRDLKEETEPDRI